MLTGPGDLSNVAPAVNDLATMAPHQNAHAVACESWDRHRAARGVTDFNGAMIAKDQRGKTRPQGPVCDSGAVDRVPITFKMTLPVINPQGIAVDPGIDQVYVASQKSSPPPRRFARGHQREFPRHRGRHPAQQCTHGAPERRRQHQQSPRLRLELLRRHGDRNRWSLPNGVCHLAQHGRPPHRPHGRSRNRAGLCGELVHSTARVLDGTVATLPNLSTPSFQLPSPGYASAAAAFNPQTGLVYVTDAISNKLMIINGAGAVPTGVSEPLRPVPFPSWWQSITRPGAPMYQSKSVHRNGRKSVDQYDRRIAHLGGAHPRGIAVNPETNRIYVVTNGSDRLKAIDGATHNVIATFRPAAFHPSPSPSARKATAPT